MQLTDEVQILNRITVKHKTVMKIVATLFLSIGGYAIYDNHYEAFVTDNSYELASDCWCCLNSRDLNFSSVSFMCNEIIKKRDLCKKKFWNKKFRKKSFEKNIFLKNFEKKFRKKCCKKVLEKRILKKNFNKNYKKKYA